MAHLLIVEDDDLLRDGLPMQMSQAGHSVLAVADGMQARNALEEQRFDGVLLDPHVPLGWLNEQPLDLTQREWELLSLLVSQAGQVVSREEVLAAWQADPQESGLGSNALEVYVHRLRRKLQDSHLSIRNVRGLGYLLESTPP